MPSALASAWRFLFEGAGNVTPPPKSEPVWHVKALPSGSESGPNGAIPPPGEKNASVDVPFSVSVRWRVVGGLTCSTPHPAVSEGYRRPPDVGQFSGSAGPNSWWSWVTRFSPAP